VYDGPVVDAHHHFWRQADLPWLAGPSVPRIFGDYAPLRRDYPLAEYLNDVRPCGVEASVYVQANWRPDRSAEEVAWVQAEADHAGAALAIVGYADLAAPDLAGLLDRECAVPRLRGIRQQLHWHAREQYRFAARADLVNDPQWRRGLAEVAGRGLLFELQVFPAQFEDAARLARDVPDLQIVLLHAGMLEDRSAAGWAQWRRGMAALSGCGNVAVKLSALGTFVRGCSAEAWGPVIRQTVGFFGAERCMFGSNYPIEKMWVDYRGLIETVRSALDPLPDAAQRQVLHDTARRIYRIPG